MRRIGRQLARTLPAVAGLALLATAPGAQAQWNPFKPNFGRPVEPAPAPAPSPAAEPADPAHHAPGAAAPAAKPAAPKTVKAPLPPRRPAAVAADTAATPAASPAETATAAPTAKPVPVRPPPGTTAAPAAGAGQAASKAAAAAKPAAAADANPIPTTPQAALARVNAYLNSYDTIQADFIQHNPSGQKAEGSLYVKRPGQLRFRYDPPSSLEVVADGRSVAVRDKRLGTNDVYSIGQTPLKFLLRDRVDLGSDTKLLNVTTDPAGIIRVTVEDSSTLGGTSRLTLIFDSKANELKQWNVVDPQGYRTSVALYNLKLERRTAQAVPAESKSALDKLFSSGQ